MKNSKHLKPRKISGIISTGVIVLLLVCCSLMSISIHSFNMQLLDKKAVEDKNKELEETNYSLNIEIEALNETITNQDNIISQLRQELEDAKKN